MINHRNVLKQYPLLILVALFTFIGCNKEEVSNENKFENTIDFENLKVGQKAYYVMYRANSYTYIDGFRYTGDSLKLEVKKSDSGALVLEEQVTEFSRNFDHYEFPVEMEIETKPEFSLVPPNMKASMLFFYTTNPIQFSLKEKIGQSIFDVQDAVSENPFNNKEINFIDNFNFGDISINQKHVISQVGFGIKKANIAYDEKGIQLSHVTFDNPEYPVVGWVRL